MGSYVRCGIEPQPRDYGKGVAMACVNRDPLTPTALAEVAELGGAQRRLD